MLKKLILTLSVLALGACAFNNDDSGADKLNKKLAEQNRKTAESFAKVEGSYTGNLIRENGATEVIQIALILSSVQTGTNTDGSAQISYKQKAAYTRLNPASQPITNLDASYTPENGLLNILNPAATTNDDIQTIFATIKDGIMSGTVKSKAGIIGRFNAKFVVGGSANGGNGSDEEYYDRLRRELTAISGTYYGCVITTKEMQQRNVPSYKAKMTLSLFEKEATGNTTQPTLVGEFRRNYDKTDFTKAILTGVYRSDFVPATLTLNGRYPAGTNGYSSAFKGSLSASGEYVADFMNGNGGIEGKMYFKRGQTYPAKCANVDR
ncbi:hypothetical protein B9G69_004345 [Bdellovibrio sp. SKB1291214]|uniref:hypothetical protein n=1 Tax=Bdellovibrio sp. SKB1291214 TaxID=1732569 RepID=UPI000B51D314|nr:hypothetical protein [Bdellovibrio sp. SKB1291214]UYL09804.1 hypothetical protein B9G69_004345 [Bdellovibrio sp. SKB1291214]